MSDEGTATERFIARQTHRELVGGQELGARSFVRYDLFDQEGQQIGSMQEETVDLFEDRLFGRWGVEIRPPGRMGTLYAEGLLSNIDDPHVVPLLAGTGDFAGARGEMTLAFTAEGECDVTLVLSDVAE